MKSTRRETEERVREAEARLRIAAHASPSALSGILLMGGAAVGAMLASKRLRRLPLRSLARWGAHRTVARRSRLR